MHLRHKHLRYLRYWLPRTSDTGPSDLGTSNTGTSNTGTSSTGISDADTFDTGIPEDDLAMMDNEGEHQSAPWQKIIILLWRKKSIQENGLKLVCQNQVICQPSSEPHSRHFPKQVIHHSLGEHWPCTGQWFNRPDISKMSG